MKNINLVRAAVVLVCGLAFVAGIDARDVAGIRGTVSGPDGHALAGAKVDLATPDGTRTAETSTDARGAFGIAGLPQGRYRISCSRDGEAPVSSAPLDLGGFETVFVRLKLVPTGPQKGLIVESLSRDPGSLSSATTIDTDQMRLLPSGGSVWSLIENQDMSATTDRIDVGGMRSDLPALFSARGGTSWTENEYRLNGMDVTDPYEGGLPFYVPDLSSLRTVRLENAGHTAGTLSPGGVLDLVTKDGGNAFAGSFSAFAGDRRLVSSNITPALEKEGILEADTLKSSLGLHFDLSGPVVPGKLFFFTSFSALRITRDPADFAEDDKGAVTTGLLRLRYEAGRSSWSFLWTGQVAKNPTAGAGRQVPFISTLDRKNSANILQIEGTFRLAPGHVLAAGAGFNRTDLSSRSQEGASGQAGIDLLGGISGPSDAAGQGRRELLTAFVRGDLMAMTGRTNHRLEYGAEARRASASTRPDVAGNVLLRFFDGVPYEVVRYGAPAEHRETSFESAVFIQETLTFPNLVAVSLGAHASYTRGRAGAGTSAIDWLHI
ncbi:MAG TPA: TonB-dependent receptor, partial [Acidobacteriota bacterium]|nr:TonB-dependent receptor [Acidobacteriota bacterium]